MPGFLSPIDVGLAVNECFYVNGDPLRLAWPAKLVDEMVRAFLPGVETRFNAVLVEAIAAGATVLEYDVTKGMVLVSRDRC